MNINNKWLVILVFLYTQIGMSSSLLDQSGFILDQNLYTLQDIRPYLIINQLLSHQSHDNDIDIDFSKDAFEKARDMMIQDLIVDEYLSKVNSNDEYAQKQLNQRFEALTNEKTKALLKQYNIDMATFKKAYLQEYKKEKFIQESIAFRANVNQSKVQNYYEEHKDLFLTSSKEDAMKQINESMEKNSLVVQYKQWLGEQIQRKKMYLFSFDAF